MIDVTEWTSCSIRRTTRLPIALGAALRAFAAVARQHRIPFMVIGGTYRDVAIRAASTREIDVVPRLRAILAAYLRVCWDEPEAVLEHAERSLAVA